MKKIHLNFKDPEPEAEELTANRVVADILTRAWFWAMQQRNRPWELWCESAEAYLHKRTKQRLSKVKAQTGRGQVILKPQRRSATAPPAHEWAQNHRTRRLLKLARQAEDLVRQFHRHAALIGGLNVVPWSVLRLWEKIWQSGEGQLSEACWDVVRQHHFPSREQVSRVVSDLREEARQAHEDDRENRMTTCKNWLRAEHRAACSWCKGVEWWPRARRKQRGRIFAMLQAVLQLGMSDIPAKFEETWKSWEHQVDVLRKSFIVKAG